MNRRLTASTGLAALALTLIACDAAPTRLGTTADPVTITAVYSSGFGGIGSDALDALVALTSDQPVNVDRPRAGSGRPQEEFDALEALAAGNADLTVVRAGALAQRGAASISVLQTPLLVISPEHADEVAAGAVAEDLMADLSELDLTGLALIPGGIRHPFGYGRALYGATDYKGLDINSGLTNGVDPMIEALGARPDHSIAERRLARVTSGELDAIEASLLQTGPVDRPAVVTSNVSLYTKFDVVVIRKDAWDGLTGAQQDALSAAAVQAGHEAERMRGTEAAALDDWCAMPEAASVVASKDDVASIADALAPTIRTMTANPAVKELADRVAALGAGTEPPPGRVCGALEIGTTIEDFLVERVGDQSVFDGVWRVDASYQDFVDAGVSVADARINAGVWTLMIKDHVATVDQPNGPDCAWDFSLNADRVSLDMIHGGNDACYGLVVGTWHRDGDVVRFTWEKERYYDVAIDQAFFKRGMQRIG
ncbi:MAG: hypothetical protein ABIR39_09150 [Nocardioides sp.]|uniref:TRAP transporter substrate-binding protein n=1 Tax=Nocardioides sp. TaxID=35761 RepID=UPI0032655D89